MPDYKNMSVKEAVRLAYAVSGMTHDQIAKASNMSPGSITKFAEGDSYLPNLDRIAPMCKALGNVIMRQWLEAQFEQAHDIAPAKSRAEVMTVVARASASLGDVQRVLADSEDRGIDPPCAREALLGITKQGNKRLRTLLILAARAVMTGLSRRKLDENGMPLNLSSFEKWILRGDASKF